LSDRSPIVDVVVESMRKDAKGMYILAPTGKAKIAGALAKMDPGQRAAAAQALMSLAGAIQSKGKATPDLLKTLVELARGGAGGPPGMPPGMGMGMGMGGPMGPRGRPAPKIPSSKLGYARFTDRFEDGPT
jgi:hypothetical protein